MEETEKKVEIIDLVKYRNFLLKNLKEEARDLALAESDPLHTPMREIRQQRIKDLCGLLKEIETTFKKVGVFNTDEFTNFMTQFLTLTEEDKVRVRFRPEYKDGTKGNPACYVVCGKETSEILKDVIKTNKDLEDFMNSKTTDDITKIRGEVVYPFKKNLRMKDKYRTHYRLKIAIYELMQLKLDNPEMTDEERYRIVLENTVQRNLKRSNETK